MYKISKLKNGLTILKVPIRGAKSVLVDVFVKVGSRSEPPRINGVSHFLEHLFFKGSKRFPTAMDLSHSLDAIGAEYNANTGKEHTQYYIKAAGKHFRFIFETLSDVLQNPLFLEEEIERERGVIVEEINMYEDSPIQHVEDVAEEVMWPGQALGRNIAGSKKSVANIKRRDIVSYKETFYQPKNMILAVAGRFSEPLLKKLADKHWSALPSKSFPKWAGAVDSQKSPRAKVEKKATEQYHLSIGFRSFDHNHKDNAVQTVLAAILGGGMSSRLFTEIRERRGLAYYVRAGSSGYQDTGSFGIKAGIRTGALNEALSVIESELKKIKSEGVKKIELKKAKEYLKGGMTLSLESGDTLLAWYLGQTAFRDRILSPEDEFRLIDRVDGRDIRRVASHIFQNNKISIAVVGPKAEKLKINL